MPARSTFEYAVVRVVPSVERGEFVNVGVILFSREAAYLAARVALDPARLRALAPALDAASRRALAAHLASIPRIAAGEADAGPIARLSQPERFHWLVAPRSTMIQVSEVHSGLCDDPAAALDRLFAELVAVRSARNGPRRPRKADIEQAVAALRRVLAPERTSDELRAAVRAALAALGEQQAPDDADTTSGAQEP